MSSPDSRSPGLSDANFALIVYILYFAAFVTGITPVIGVIIAHVKVGTADPMLATHFRFQIRTFWLSVLIVVVGAILCLVLIGFVILFLWVIWAIVRNVKGLIALNDNRPIANPDSWMFG
jgi:uncharacterized membrane protein